MCPVTINQTESARLVLELERWIGKPIEKKDTDTTATITKKQRGSRRRRLILYLLLLHFTINNLF